MRAFDACVCIAGERSLRPFTPIFVRSHPGNTPPNGAFPARPQVNTTLKEINLYYNNIGPEGATAFAEALKVRW